MGYYKTLLFLLCLMACQLEKTPEDEIYDDAAILHKDLYEINHKLINELGKKQMSISDSGYLSLAEYIDVVVLAVIEESGGQKTDDGDLMFPKDTIRWIETLEKIDFKENWRSGTNALPPQEKTAVGKMGLERINRAVKRKMPLDRFCIELRLIQLEIIGHWVENSY